MNAPSSFVCSPAHRMRRQRGVGLLEVMIAVLVLGIGVLGVMALQTFALKNTDSSALSSQATVQIYAMFDLLRANNDKKSGGGGVPNTFNTDWAKASGSGSAEVGTLNHWLEGLQKTLGPDAEGMVKCTEGKYGQKTPKGGQGMNENAICTVGVRWNDERAGGDTAKVKEIELGILL